MRNEQTVETKGFVMFKERVINQREREQRRWSQLVNDYWLYMYSLSFGR